MGLIVSVHALAGGGYSRWWLRGQGALAPNQPGLRTASVQLEESSKRNQDRLIALASGRASCPATPHRTAYHRTLGPGKYGVVRTVTFGMHVWSGNAVGSHSRASETKRWGFSPSWGPAFCLKSAFCWFRSISIARSEYRPMNQVAADRHQRAQEI